MKKIKVLKDEWEIEEVKDWRDSENENRYNL